VTQPTASSSGTTRRDFLAASAATVAGATLLAPHVHAAGGDVLKIGLIGCGGRGSGAAANALKADPNVKLTAMGDAFADRIQKSLSTLRDDGELAKKIDVKPENCFVGFDAYKQVIASGVDVVVLTSPPHFRPAHIKAAVEAGKHIFAEKPVAVDAPGVRSVLDSCREAKKKNLSVVSGLCWRYHPAKRETMKRVLDGQIGDIVALHCTYNAGPLWSFRREEGWSDMEYQLRNWLYYTWLSGDHIVEQAIHSLDKMAWAMKDEPPVNASGTGGRQVRTDPLFGHIFDHHAVVFEYKNGVRMFHFCRQQGGHTHRETSDFIMGTEGICAVMKHNITGKNPWAYKSDKKIDDGVMYQVEHDELFASIRNGKPINDGERMSYSTLLAIMGRMATYTGEVITWEKALNSAEVLNPPMEGFKGEYKFGPLSVPEVAMPGKTKFV
jgi:predicted dehydrogenase